jgi:hypothetical protein
MRIAEARHHRAQHNLLLWLAALALAVRVLVPAGYMPAEGKGFEITLCTGDGMVAAWVDDHGNVHKGQKAPDGKSDHPCAFSGIGALAEAEASAGAVALPLATSQAPPVGLGLAYVGQGLAAPPPPPTGPPLFA